MPDGTYQKLGMGIEGSVQALEHWHALARMGLAALTNGRLGAWIMLLQKESIRIELSPRYVPCPPVYHGTHHRYVFQTHV